MKVRPLYSQPTILAALLGLTIALPLEPAFAADRNWITSTGPWDLPDNWSGAAVPVSGDIAYIDNGGTASLPMNATGAASTLIIGNMASGALEITGGNLSGIAANLGYAVGSSGAATLSGASSVWDLESFLTVGSYGTAAITVSNGAMLCNYDYGWLAAWAGSVGTVTVDGEGSFWESSFLNVGLRGAGTLNITQGGQVVCYYSDIGLFAGSNGVVIVDGTSSTFTDTGELSVGGAGTGKLRLINGGTANVSGTLTVGSLGAVEGDGNINGNVSNGGLVSPGNSPGLLHVAGNYTQAADGKLKIELAGAAAGSYDQLLVTGDIALAGTLEVSLIDGFLPTAGDQFKVLGFSSRSGSFATLSLPALSGGLGWDTTRLYSDGVLSALANDGDLDDNGQVNAADIDILWSIVRGTGTDPNNNDTADLNGDTLVNEDDVDTMLAGKLDAGTNRAYGDANLSGGTPELTDYNLWRTGTGGWANGDFDGSGGVPELTDYNLWRTGPTQLPDTVGSHGGGGGSGAPMVPEPASFLLAAIAVGHFLVVRRLRGFRRS